MVGHVVCTGDGPAVNSQGGNAPEETEYNTDQGCSTHELCQQLFAQRGDDCIPSALFANKLEVPPSVLLQFVVKRRERAFHQATELARVVQAGRPPLAEAVFAILQGRMKQLQGPRRGPPMTPAARAVALDQIAAAMARPGGLRLALLTFPCRDLSPVKSVGQLPDAGEVEALIRLWMLGVAIRLLGLPCKVLVLRDSRRYPCFWHEPQEKSEAYGAALSELIDALSLGDVLELRDVDDDGAGDNESQVDQQVRMQCHHGLYQAGLSSFLEELAPQREPLLSARSEPEFRERLLHLPCGRDLLSMMFPVLHSLPPCAVEAFEDPQEPSARRQILQRLIGIFKPQGAPEETEETARRELLWQALVGAAQYIASYRSRSAANNHLGADDVASVAPGSLRLSIHSKGADWGWQFPVQVGQNVHRTPWHGTAELRWSRRQRQPVIDVKMAAEMWHDHVAVFPASKQASPEGVECPRSWDRYCARLEEACQPFFLADPVTLPAGWQCSQLASLWPRQPRAALVGGA
mmetsp:Transcript_112427/g.318050  ORF Transcript_112427/g.318050 Transcript_112427/m.318050 type:complete len:521 (+) Transcript_112427:80-1642(+)|eukprot:CAMPEP_0168373006 /NCGR_PEP_ID=MMETSP0228-20121227/8570_1 /TAXON_ID=133427 /ORGANISM="Protoceratium reticulatum, Strain CCCM 535 (=CCMP 1889)" /LENGTH=520 /DNA_ID=CAMNT_0008385923 /DNA_START=84 /DNA_END=1646 /DNA_ORIENTATION=+